ncbi:MAG: DUF6036 family nucleotidyltransferase [Acidobacteriota bacterium]
MSTKVIPQPWLSFLRDVDALLHEETYLHCIGGFVVTVVYGAVRDTSDLDALTLVRHQSDLFDRAGIGSDLFKQYGLYLDPVGIATLPENYEDRLEELFLGTFSRLHLFALDPYDIALAKIERNGDVDRQDVLHLARVVPFDLEVFRTRYIDELRVYLGNPEREDLTLKLWIEMIEEERAGQQW